MSADKSVRCEIAGHAYVVVPHPTMEGIRFAAVVVGAAIGPLLGLLDSAMKAGLIKEDAALSAETFLALLDHADIGQLSADLRGSIETLSPEDFASLFKYTMRDGLALRDRAVFDSAYAGNWKEFYLAVAKIVEVNHFLPF